MHLKISIVLLVFIATGLWGCGKPADPATESTATETANKAAKRDGASTPPPVELPPLVKSIPIDPGPINQPTVFSASN
ncbi:MAG TPA: hypothetical protein VLB90_03315 [Pseudomonadales bacterium]|nr:hypothetical protein [Pseudomonadales bacterium]